MGYVVKAATADTDMRKELEVKQLLVNLEAHRAHHRHPTCSVASLNRALADLAIAVDLFTVPPVKQKVPVLKPHPTAL